MTEEQLIKQSSMLKTRPLAQSQSGPEPRTIIPEEELGLVFNSDGTVDKERSTNCAQLGEGGFAIVYKVVSCGTGTLQIYPVLLTVLTFVHVCYLLLTHSGSPSRIHGRGCEATEA